MTTPPANPRQPTLPALIQQYYADLRDLAHQHVMYEMGTRPAFHALLAAAGREHGQTLVAEHEKKRSTAAAPSAPTAPSRTP